MTIDESLATAPIIDKAGYSYIIHPLMDGVPRVDPDLLRAWAAWAAQLPFVQQATVLLAPEAMAIPLAAAVSLQTGIPYVVARKRQYGLEGEQIAYCETGYGSDCIYVNDIHPEDRVAVLDDVVSTGGTLTGILGALATTKATVLGVAAFIDKGGAADLAARTGTPVVAMRRIHVEAGRVRIAEPDAEG